MKNYVYKFRLCALIFLGGILFFSCARNPVTGKKEFMLMSINQEKSLGASYDPQVVGQFGNYEDKRMQQFIQNHGKRMARISHRPDLNYQFRVLDSPVVNAFAVPGGYVYFTRGIMAHFNNEAEFMGVLGHEIGHITARHSAKQYTNQMLAQIGFIAGMVASEKFRQYGDLANTGLALMFLKFGRNHESQSDKLGVEYSTAVGYDSHQMANFFRTIQRIQMQSGGGVPNLLSTHPDPGDRYTRVHQLSEKEQTKKGKRDLKVNRESYLRMIDGMVYGEDPRQGFVENWNFYHPEMKFQFPIPQNWQVSNSPAQVQMAPQNGQALMVLALSGEKTLTAAANAAIQQDQLQVINQRNVTVNGNQGIEITANLNEQVRVLMTLIQYNGNIYKFSGLAETANFNAYRNTFMNTFGDFRTLTDPDKLNREAERLDIVTVKQDDSLSNLLKANGIPSARLDEFSILNGMELNSKVEKGTMVKVLER